MLQYLRPFEDYRVKPPTLLSLAASFIATAAIAAGCGGGGALSLPEYFQRLDRAFEESNSQLTELETKFDEAVAAPTTDKQQIDAFRLFFGGSAAVVADTRETLNDLKPPVEARDAHARFMASMDEVLALSGDFLKRLVDVTTLPDLEELTLEFDPRVDAASEGGNQACGDLQAIAAQNQIDVDLDCSQ